MSEVAKLGRREMAGWVLAGALALAFVGRVAFDRSTPPVSDGDPAVVQARSAVADLQVRDSAGRRVPLAPLGRPSIMMVNSKSCAFCREALMAIAELQGDAAVPMLRVVTLEGEAVGRDMLASLGVRGAFNAGPDGESDQVLLTFRIPGTPVFARTDRDGRIVETVPGYPGPAVLARWMPVMHGTQR